MRFRKPPVLPRVLWDIAAHLSGLSRPEHVASAGELRVFVSCVAVYLSFLFGWRDHTCSRLSLDDISFDSATSLALFSERFSKGAFSRAR